MITLPVFPAVDAQPLVDYLLPYLKRIIMTQDELKVALEAVAGQLTQFGADLDSDIAQLGKAQSEIILALSSLGTTTPEVDAALASLRAAADALNARQGTISTVAQSLDDLNVDAPPAP